MDLARMRSDYEARGLAESDLAADPLDQFMVWLQEAVDARLAEPNAMVVSTVDSAGQPWSRHLLLKGLSDGGFEFYTNYTSDKAAQLDGEKRVALTFGWLGLNRQVNVTGTAARVTEAESDAYFSLRPRGSQLGAWASNQSSPLSSRNDLETAFAAADAAHPELVPRPPHWGGYRVTPATVEFWQGNPSRLHDRLRYVRDVSGWRVVRLNP
ncbi:MAG: pyridoxamine 5'-phosphate oxidase [Acidimicrobiales bacterium]